MAIGFGSKKAAAPTVATSTAMDSPPQNAEFGDKSYYNGFSPAGDVEKAGQPGAARKMSRIDRPITKSISGSYAGGMATDDDASDPSVSVGKQMELEAAHQTAALLFSEYICLAIMSFPYSYALLGLVPGLILTVVVAGLVLYTSLVVWEFCLRHPEVKDVCDIGQMLFWNQRWAWWATAVMFILNNTFIMVHVTSIFGLELVLTIASGSTLSDWI
nr:n amino acid transport system protein [Quercus suber]